MLFCSYFHLGPTGECVCRGDPHCFAFDADRSNKEHDLETSNVCTYVLQTNECSENGTFIISGVFERVKNTKSMKSFVKEVAIITAQENNPNNYIRIKLRQGLQARFGNGMIQSFPKQFGGHRFEIIPAVFAHPKDFTSGVTEVMSYTMPNGINIQYDGIKAVKINIDNYSGPSCGLCGNGDGIYDENDFQKGYNLDGKYCEGLQVPGPKYGLASSKQEFVNSWLHAKTLTKECVELCDFVPS
ncbi:hypothetical protein CAPTEDRAFT_190806 [Capitella teleta]|uniref:VWFD domain-containing protein n=1 Tax=Capitella teleta TaxID=283909 RepID=R7TH71_CAPTE|nr:hypothetical protein CAPTEDRAFT_190806 [Capitella teleta]|eukprot:ELT90926.1 hypothetical protein CAPTEDRAFT_190806 [Capitella teleta]